MAAELRHPCRKRLPSSFHAGLCCIIVWLVNVFRFDQGRRRPHKPLGDHIVGGEMNHYDSLKLESASPQPPATNGEPELGAIFALLLMFQLVVAGLFAPGPWSSRMFSLFFALDLYLAFRLFVFYKIRRRPIPAISSFVKVAILTSPIYMAVLRTYLMVNIPGF